MHRTRCWTVAAAFCLLVVPALGAQSVPRVSLGKAEGQLPDPFDNVSAVGELRDGRVIVADRMAKTVTLADFRSGQATAIGREGQGPGEFAFPTGLVALPGDTTLLVDPGQRRFLVIDPAGKPTSLVSFPNGMMGLVRVKGADRQGRIYLQGAGFGGGMTLGGGQSDGKLPDSATVLRWDRGRNHLDTLGHVKTPSTQMATSSSAGARSVVMRQQPFSPQDEWTVAPDGRVGVLRVGDYHAEWWTPAGQRVAGAPVTYAKAPVTQADKDRFTQASNNPRGRFNVTVGGPGRGAASPPPPQLSEPDWPQYKPPFREGTAQVAPDGTLWVQRYGADGAPLVYDVFDVKGNLTRQVQFPKAAHLVGFGAASVYVATTTDDELETLGRYRMP